MSHVGQSHTCESEEYKVNVTPKRCSSCTPLIQLTWHNRSESRFRQSNLRCHRTPTRTINSSSSSGSSSGSSTGSGSRLSVIGQPGTQQFFLESPRVQQLREESEGHSDVVLETDLKGMYLGRGDMAQVHNSTSVSMIQTVNEETPRKSGVVSRTFNPFEHDLVETMHLSSFSPSVFSKVVTPSKEEEQDDGCFSWGIDNIAVLYPSNFEDATTENNPTPKNDPEVEDRLQQAINTFFHTVCVPSPWLASATNRVMSVAPDVPLQDQCSAKGNKSANVSQNCKSTRDEEYCTFHKNQEMQNNTRYLEEDTDCKEMLSTSSLRRKLFTNDVVSPADSTPKSTKTAFPKTEEPRPSDHLPQTPDQFTSSPLREIIDRHQRASLTPPTIISPTVSPIKVLTCEIDESNHVPDEGNDDDVSFMSTCHTQSLLDDQEPLNLSKSRYARLQSTGGTQLSMGHRNHEIGIPIPEVLDEDMEKWMEAVSDADRIMACKTSFMDTMTDNSCGVVPGSYCPTTESLDTGYNTKTQISSGSEGGPSFSTSIQAPVQLWSEKMPPPNGFGGQNTTNSGQPGNLQTVWSPLVASTPSRSCFPMYHVSPN